MHNEPRTSSRDGQPINVDAPDHAVLSSDVEMPIGEVEVGADDENPNLQRVPELPSEENPSVQPSSEPRLQPPRRRIATLQFERNVRARRSTSSVPLVSSSEEALAFSASGSERACLCVKKTMKKGWC